MTKNIIFFLLLLLKSNTYCQTALLDLNPSTNLNSSYPDTALYDVFGLDYQFSQFMKHSIRYGSVGASTGLSISIGYILCNDIDGISAGILSATGTIVGSGIGYIAGSIVGIMRGYTQKKQKNNNPKFYHKMDHFGYSFGGSGSLSELTRIGPLYSISMRNFYKKSYFPERIYLTFENLDWQGAYSENEDSHSDDVREFRFGTTLRYYIKDRSIVNFYYEFGLGYTTGEYWGKHQTKENFSYIYADVILGTELNMFDFFYGEISMVLEPIGPYFIIQNKNTSLGNIFMLRASVGTYIF